MSRSADTPLLALTPTVLLKAYMCGIFPMAESANSDHLYWIEPDMRGVVPLDRAHVPKRLRRTVRSDKFEIRVDSDFDAVIGSCAAANARRRQTWINGPIRKIYREMFDAGHCHTVEAWRNGELAGGLYGVSINGAFFGESMFAAERDASKVALVHLMGRLIRGGFRLLDTQFYSEHLAMFGAVEVPKAEFSQRLERALEFDAEFFRMPAGETGAGVLDIIDGNRV